VSEKQLTPGEAHAAILAGHVVRVVVDNDPEDHICLMYLDECFEDDFELMIHTESVGGRSEGVKECVCEPDSDFFVGWLAEPAPLSIAVTYEEPPQRESGVRHLRMVDGA
jgi:hypothetical protein